MALVVGTPVTASALTPGCRAQEKLDHLGIVALVVGTPVTALMAHEHGEVPLDVKVCFALMLAAAFLPPAPRVAGFSVGTVAMIGMHCRTIFDANLAAQLCLYGLGALCFLRRAPRPALVPFSFQSLIPARRGLRRRHGRHDRHALPHHLRRQPGRAAVPVRARRALLFQARAAPCFRIFVVESFFLESMHLMLISSNYIGQHDISHARQPSVALIQVLACLERFRQGRPPLELFSAASYSL